MHIPSVSSMFRSRAGTAGLPPAGVSRTGFSNAYAEALGNGGPQANGTVQELTVLKNPAKAAQTQTTIAVPKQASAISKAYGTPAYIPASSLQPVSAADSDAGLADKVVAFAKQFVGTPYVPGGEDLNKGVDCSGFTQSVFKQFGINLPRSSYRQSLVGQEVDVKNLQPGDLLFFKTDDYAPVTHVAIYIGDGKIVHASSRKTGVIISKLKIRDDFRIARRML